jgi:hypothetical protein
MRKMLYFTVAAAAIALSAATVLPASADTPAVLTYGSLGGTSVAVGDTIAASLAPGTNVNFYTDSSDTSGVTCTTSSFSSTVETNPASSGVATESVASQTFDNCTANVGGVNSVQSVTADNLPWAASVDDSANTITITGAETTLVVNSIVGQLTCNYTADGGSLAGTVNNSDNSITFTNQKFDLASGSSFWCNGNGYFSGTYSPVQDGTQGNAAVFVN